MQQLGLPIGQGRFQLTQLPRRTIHPSSCPRLPPPAIALAPAPASRTAVVAHAKRGSKRSKSQEPEGDSEGGWDAALSGIPTDDEPSDPVQEPSGQEQEPPAQPPAPPSGNPGRPRMGGRGQASGSLSGLVNTSLPQTTMTLREYQLLMEAKAAKEAREEAERKAAEAARLGVAIVPPEPAIMDMNRQGFQAFVLEGGDLELLVAETAEGRLSLADCYVYDPHAAPPPEQLPPGASPGVTGVYSRPEVAAGVPGEPLLFQALPWVERGSGDVFKRKDPVNNIKKVFFIGIDESDGLDEMTMDLDHVYCFDSKSRTLTREEVRMVGTDLVEPVLRIRPTGLTLEEAFLLPDPIEVSESAESGSPLADLSPEELQERLEELERDNDMMDEFDEVPDVPSVDMM